MEEEEDGSSSSASADDSAKPTKQTLGGFRRRLDLEELAVIIAPQTLIEAMEELLVLQLAVTWVLEEEEEEEEVKLEEDI